MNVPTKSHKTTEWEKELISKQIKYPGGNPFIIVSKQCYSQRPFVKMLTLLKEYCVGIIQIRKNKKYILIRQLKDNEMSILDTYQPFKFDNRKYKAVTYNVKLTTLGSSKLLT